MAKSFRIPMTVDQLLNVTRMETGIDIIDHDVVEGLSRLIKSLNEEGEMHETGAIELQSQLLQKLKNRLRMLRDFKNHPEIFEQELRAPIMISGTLRTGSTKLQNILAESGDFNWCPLWEVNNFASYTGKPNEDVSGRIANAEAYVAYNSLVSPEIRAAHVQETYKPEEETAIMMQNFCSTAWFGYATVPSYLQWVSTQDMKPTFEFLRDALKYLQWQGLADPNKRWILKSPFNVGLENVIQSVFPDVSFVVTHRDPSQTLPSLFSLISALLKCHSPNVTLDTQGLAVGQAMTLETQMQIRKSNPDIPFLDLHYKKVVTDIENAIRQIYEFVKEPLSSTSLQRMMSWETANPIHKHGNHKYSITDYSLSKDQVAAMCPSYMSFYKQKFENLG